jgi:predicted RNase H-like nuclease
MVLLGIDGCPAGWIAAESDDGASPIFRLFRTFREVVEAIEARDTLACIDVPIGLSSLRRKGDGEARARLGGRRACCWL